MLAVKWVAEEAVSLFVSLFVSLLLAKVSTLIRVSVLFFLSNLRLLGQSVASQKVSLTTLQTS